MVLICAPLSRRAMQLSPLTLTLATFLILYHLFKGVRIQEGSLYSAFYALGVLSWGTFGMAIFPRGPQPPFLSTIPSFQFKGASAFIPASCGQLQMKWSGLSQ